MKITRYLLLAVLLVISTAYAEYWSLTSPMMSPTWPRMYDETERSAPGNAPGSWRFFDASIVNFDAGKPIVGDLTLIGEDPGCEHAIGLSWVKPRLCIFTKAQFAHLDRNKPIQDQAESCFDNYAYNSTDRKYIIRFVWLATVAGGYYFLFLANTQTPAHLSVTQETLVRNQIQIILPIGLGALSGVFGLAHLGTERRRRIARSHRR